MTAEGKRRWRLKYPEKAQAANRRDKMTSTRRDRHGIPAPQIRTALWDAQDGRCYLCNRPLNPQTVAYIDHDHRCCPLGKSCRTCRRGLACAGCNTLIGHANDSPEFLRLIADNLALARDAVDVRMASKPVQAALDDVAASA